VPLASSLHCAVSNKLVREPKVSTCFRNHASVFWLTGALFFCNAALAEDAPTQLDTIEVVGFPDPEIFDYAEARRLITGFDALKERDRITLRFWISPRRKDIDLTKIKLYLNTQERSVEIPISADGSIRIPLLDEKELPAEFSANVKRGSLKASSTIEAVVPTTNDFRYRDAFGALSQVDEAERSLGPIWIRLLPRHKALAFKFDTPSTVTIISNSGSEQTYTTRDNLAIVPLDKRHLEDNPLVRCQSVPRRLIPH